MSGMGLFFVFCFFCNDGPHFVNFEVWCAEKDVALFNVEVDIFDYK